MKRIALLGFAVVSVLLGLAFYRWQSHRLKRVSVSYAEKYEDATIDRSKDTEFVRKESDLYAEEELSNLIAHDRGCLVLTHDSRKADYNLSISVVRYVGGGNIYGEATLSITRPHCCPN